MPDLQQEIYPNIVYYNDDHSKTPECTIILAEYLKFTFTTPASWQELVKEFESGATNIIFHMDTIARSMHSTPIEFVDAVRTTAKFITGKDLIIGVIIKPNISLSMIRSLQKAGVQGIILDFNHYSIEEVLTGTHAHLNNIPYWPTHLIDELIDAEKKPLVLHFREDFDRFANNAVVHDIIQSETGCRRLRVKTWNAFLNAIQAENPEFITIHYAVLDTALHSLSEFINAIRAMLQYLPLDKRKNIPIAIGIDEKCTKEFVEQLKELGVAGIHPAGTAFGADETIAAIKTLLSGKEYWPEHIISNLPSAPSQPLHIYFREDWSTYFTALDFENFKKSAEMNIVCCKGWDDLDEAIIKNPHQIVLNVDMLKCIDATIPEIMSMLTIKLKLAKLSIPIGVSIDPDTPLSLIKEFKKAGILGIVPSASSWGTSECIIAMHALRDRVSYWPKHIIDQLPGKLKKSATPGKIQLTGRQAEVFHHIIKRGSSNKVIARALGISESTVKLHVTEIFKKYGVRSRTQLAVFSSTP